MMAKYKYLLYNAAEEKIRRNMPNAELDELLELYGGADKIGSEEALIEAYNRVLHGISPKLRLSVRDGIVKGWTEHKRVYVKVEGLEVAIIELSISTRPKFAFHPSLEEFKMQVEKGIRTTLQRLKEKQGK